MSTQIMSYDLMPPMTDDEKSIAGSVQAQIDILIESCRSSEEELQHSYARLGSLLNKMQVEKLWIPLGYKNFRAYLEEVGAKIKKQPSQLYAYISVSDKLLPQISESDLADMGIAKAQVLQGVLKAGKPVTDSMIQKALDPKVTATELKAAVFSEAHIHTLEDEFQKYHDFGGAYLTAEERKEYERAVEVAIKVIGIGPEVPEPVRKKAVVMAWVAEFLATHEADVQGGVA